MSCFLCTPCHCFKHVSKQVQGHKNTFCKLTVSSVSSEFGFKTGEPE